ncbi:MAG: WYL domain-containing protein [Fibrobacter sp.]|nr:WYL domain-containing protein [Fibrobacter sp.]
MADLTRGERRVRLFALLISHPERKYTISNLMEIFNIPENERRNLQRDMLYLSEMDGGRYIRVSGKSRSFVYSSALKSADRLLFPNFENTMLHLVFLQRIANIYPATSDTINSLLTKIKNSLPQHELDSLNQVSSDLNKRILFMGTPPDYEEDASEKLKIILQAIHECRKIKVTNITEGSNLPSIRIPLMIIVYQGELYVGCKSETHPNHTYVLKFRRLQNVTLTTETFKDDPNAVEILRKRVNLGSAILGKQEPKAEEVEIRFPSHARIFLMERPYHRSMKVIDEGNDGLLVTMKVEVNELLVRWILSYAESAIVIKPYSLRVRLHEFGNYLLSTYPTYASRTLIP